MDNNIIAQFLNFTMQRTNEIVRRKREITPDTAWRFTQAFGTTPEFRMNLQTARDLAPGRPAANVERLREFSAKSKRAFTK